MSAPRIPPEAIVFGGNPLERVEEKIRTPEWIEARLKDPQTRVLKLDRLKPAVATDRDGAPMLDWVSARDLPGLHRGQRNCVLLGMQDGIAHFAVDMTEPGARPSPDIRDQLTLAMRMHAEDTGIFAQARTLIDWHARHGFCAVCGQPTVSQAGGAMRKCSDSGCGATHYPRTDPVVIMLALYEDKCLLGRSGRFPQAFFSALAGFLEGGETIEAAVRREAFEEAGVRVGEITYVGSQPWPFPASLMMGCFCHALGPEVKVDGEEIAEARWFSRDEIRAALAGSRDLDFKVPPPYAIAHQLMRLWLDTGG
ncbi:MAG: NAD(+) diphosphatase [Gammaproteobacteria bacterium]